MYVNGVQITAFSSNTNPSQNADLLINSTSAHTIGRDTQQSTNFDGYLTEINFVDGQALDPSSFGETNLVTGVWQPKKYAGTYGTNGFYLNFSDNTGATATTIGADYSGNGNNWTPNNISVTAGVTYDSMLDVPTQWADGGNGRGNYATLNPLMQRWAVASATFSNANQTITTSGGSTSFGFGTIAVSSGKFYWEATVTAVGSSTPAVGVATNEAQSTVQTNTIVYLSNGQKEVGGSASAYGVSYTTNDVIGVALDCDGGTVTFYKNNSSQGSISLVTSANLLPHFQVISNSTFNANFGQRPFAYTPPTGFKALNTLNLPTPTILKGNQYFDATTYTATGTTPQTITNSGGMQPDLVWTKSRSAAFNNVLNDSVRGAQFYLFSNLTNAEVNDSTYLTSFNSNGFSLGTGNFTNGTTMVAWQWKANGTPAVTNTAGSITSTVSAGATQGFSVVTYTGNGSSSATVGHGLGVVPAMVITKPRSASGDWFVAHTSLGNGNLILNQTLQSYNPATQFSGGGLATLNSSTTFGFAAGSGGVGNANANGTTYVAYCFSAVAGFSAFGSYTGNGSTDGTFVYTGFRPEFVMMKRTDSTSGWNMQDAARSPSNVVNETLQANQSLSESTLGSYPIDFLSNGFKLRNTSEFNGNGATYIYAAFAENPLKYSLAR
jgi:hypothetical protein